MTHRRKLIAIGKERWGLPTTASNQDLVVGRLRMHRDGYGFVIPEPGSLPARAQGKLQGDIFIPPPEVGNAMHGDQVLVEMGRIRHDGRAEGRIVRVMEREQETVVGIFHYGDRNNYVTPIDEKVGMEIIIPRGMEYPQAEDEEVAPAEEDRDIRTGGSAHTRLAPPPSAVTHYKDRGPQAPSPAHEKPGAPSAGAPSFAAHDSASTTNIHRPQRVGKEKAPTPKHPDRESPHRVLGSEARRHQSWDDLENVVVEVEITQWPSATQNPRGRVKEILGYEDDFGVDVEMIIRKHHIPHVFPADVLEEAQEISPVIPQKEIAQRRDFRHLPIVTIDGETARDFDDAVLVRRLDNGNYELHVHIADVAHYVEDGSAIDEEARKRGTSVYFPDRAVPMLPLELSTDICSLRPDLDRLVLSCVMEINQQGEILFYELAEGVIHSAQRMTYTDVNAIIEAGSAHKDHRGPQPPGKKDHGPQSPGSPERAGFARSGVEVPPAAHEDQKGSVAQALLPVQESHYEEHRGKRHRGSPVSDHPITGSPDHPIDNIRSRYGALSENFDLMYELAQILNRKRVKRGSIDFDLPEPVIEFDEHGLMKSVTPSERNWAHRLIEEFMLAANETVAAHLEQLGIPSLYRIHEKPDAKRVYEFETIAAGFGYSLGVGAFPVKRFNIRDPQHARGSRGGADKRHFRDSGRRAPTIELPEEVHITPRMYQKLVQKITGKPEERVLSFLMLRSLKQARYSEINEGHFALASPTYTHFTSPIRRYPDLIIHRLLKWALHHDSLEGGSWEDKHAGEHHAHVAPPPSAVSDVPMSRFPDVPINREASTYNSSLRFRSASSSEHSPWSKRAEKGSSARRRASTPSMAGPISEPELHEIAESSSQTERAADEAERELMEWKKLKFMEQRVGEDFDSLIVSVTKFGFFVELTELFIEGLVPINSLTDDNYAYHDNTRQIIGARSKKTYSIGDKVRVLVDRIDHLQRKIQFAVLEEKPKRAEKRHKKRG
ncbi:MAG TPA: RNB domain-containing ribonuclease [Candidatus Angelobacter sp.]|nr:RNB domain-containing ribonuclease [Candidatus Angelobacter sp.]